MAFKFPGCIIIALYSFAALFCNADAISGSSELISQLTNSVKLIAPLEENLKLSNTKGTLLGWVRLDNSQLSRTLMSARWDKNIKESSYLVLSDGWWEHTNDKGFYFVLDNKQISFCHIDNFTFPSNQWMFVAVTWGQSNQQSYCQIYLNGQFYTENKTNIKIIKNTELAYQFSDVLTDDPEHRFSQGMTSGFFYHSSTLSWKDILSIYNATKSKFQEQKMLSSKSSSKTTNFKDFKQRILFDEDIYWALSKTNTDEVLAEVERKNFNVFIPCVWHGKGAYFKNSKGIYDPRVKYRIIAGDDPLTYLLSQAKKKNIKIIPWFTISLQESNALPEFADAGIGEAFNVHNLQFRIYISSLINEAIVDYQLEDVNLDYIRSMGICVTEKCKQDFKLKYDKDLSTEYSHTQDTYIFSKFISAWNNDAVTDILKRVRANIPSNGSVKISVDAVPLNKELQFQGQESIDWLNDGLIDTIFLMSYQRNVEINKMVSIANKVKRGQLIPIISTYDKIASTVVARVPAVLGEIIDQIGSKFSNDAIAIYHRKSLTNDQILYLNHQPEENIK